MNLGDWEAEARKIFLVELEEMVSGAEQELLSLEASPTAAPGSIQTLFRFFHTIKGGAGMVGLTELGRYTHHLESLLAEMRSGILPVTPRVIRFLLEAIDCLKGLHGAAVEGTALPGERLEHSLNEMTTLRAMRGQENEPLPELPPAEWPLPPTPAPSSAPVSSPSSAPSSAPSAAAPLTVLAPDSSPPSPQALPSPEKAPESPAPPESLNSSGSTPEPSRGEATIRVGIHKLNRLLNLVGEAVTNHARLAQLQQRVEALDEGLGEALLHILDETERITRSLQDQVNQVRMVPIGHSLLPFRRMVHDYGQRSGKRIALRVEGGQTELDKEVVERIAGPLKHLVRNAMDHGLETVAERLAAGKPEEGSITLRAYHEQGSFFIEVADDGKGVESATILRIAREKGLVPLDGQLPEEAIMALLFHPGFSTRTTVSDISGRGVGLDAVRQEIEGLRGLVTVQSRPGAGTTFRIKLPLTLAIIDGMMVRVQHNIFTLPLRSVVESLRPEPGHLLGLAQRGEVLEVRGEYIPVTWLYRHFHLGDQAPLLPSAVVVENNGRKMALLVDEILDQQTVVLKSLEENLAPIPGIAGATILGDGHISLVLDVAALTWRR